MVETIHGTIRHHHLCFNLGDVELTDHTSLTVYGNLKAECKHVFTVCSLTFTDEGA
jgi:hypothetical protein